MKNILELIKKDNDAISKEAHTLKKAKAIRVIEAFFDYNYNGCKNTELHLNACYYTWKEEFENSKLNK